MTGGQVILARFLFAQDRLGDGWRRLWSAPGTTWVLPIRGGWSC